MRPFFRKLGWLRERGRKEAELEEELRFHLEEEAEERAAAGLASQEARLAARRELGNITRVQENTRAMWSWTFWEQLIQDLRYARRTMGQNRAFTLLAALSLALGIGANTAIYSFMDAILLRSLPVSDPASLAWLNWHTKGLARSYNSVIHGASGSSYGDAKTGVTSDMFPFGAFELVRKNDSVFSSVFGYFTAGGLNLTVRGQADIANGEYVTGDYFRGLGVAAAAGRLLLADDDRVGAPAVAVVSRAFSERRFGGPASAAGQSILINNVPFTVVGVTPAEFFGVDPGTTPDFYLPMHAGLLLPHSGPGPGYYVDRNFYWIETMARLHPGVSLAAAQSALAEPFHQWVDSTAGNDRERTDLPALVVKEGAHGLDVLRRQYAKPLYILMTLVGLILAIACANIANLLLARAAARRREIALRLSVGAGRFRVVRQLLTESIVLASLGGILGVGFAIWGIRLLTVLLANGRTDFTLRAELNWHVLSVAAALSLLTGVVFGLAPAIQATGGDVMPALKDIRTSRPHSRFRLSLSHVLVVSQIALSLLMLVAAGLFVRTLGNLESVDLAFNRENVLLFRLNARQAGRRDAEIAAFYADLQKRFGSIPGVRGVSLSSQPLIGEGWTYHTIRISGAEANGDRVLPVGAGFFTTMQIPLLLGREIEERDGPGSPAVVVVNELFAKANFGNRNPIGQRLTIESVAGDFEIVGVSKDARYGFLNRDVPPTVFFPYHLYPGAGPATFAVRTPGDPLRYTGTIREIVHQADPRVPVAQVRTQSAQIDQTISQEITFARLCTGLAILALAIACVGLYGTMTYNVARRAGEIGIRMALGARRGAVVWMVLREVLALAAVGLAISVPVALGTSKVVQSFLFGMKPNDPAAMAMAVGILLAAALVAGYVPARKAAGIDPAVALRHE